MGSCFLRGGGRGCGAIGIVCTLFGGMLLGGSYAEKRGDHQKKKFFINNSVEALISFNKENGCLLKLQIPLGWEWGN